MFLATLPFTAWSMWRGHIGWEVWLPLYATVFSSTLLYHFTGLVTGTVFGLLYAYLVRFSAVALQSVEAGYARVPLSIDETARLLGSGARRLFTELHLPLLRRSAGAAAFRSDSTPH